MKNIYFDLAIIGGMGSEAASDLFARIIYYTSATNDSEHLSIVVLNLASIPHAHNNFLDNEQLDPNESILFLNKLIFQSKSRNVVIACNTFHEYSSRFDSKRFNFINMINLSLEFVSNKFKGKNIVVLSSIITVRKRLYTGNVDNYNISIRHLEKLAQSQLDEIIIGLKNTKDRDFDDLTKKLIILINKYAAENTVFLIACTELSLVSDKLIERTDYNIVDALDIAAISSIIATDVAKLNLERVKLKLPFYDS